MTKQCKKCGKSFPTSMIFEGVRRNLCKRLYCFDCSPFKEHNTSQLEKRKADIMCLTCGTKVNRNSTKYCSAKCQRKHENHLYIKRWQEGKENGMCGKEGISKLIRRYLFIKYENKCQDCGWSKIHPITKKIPLTVEHIDGNWKNNKEENLKLLCPNCHSLTLTYGSLNKGKGRRTHS